MGKWTGISWGSRLRTQARGLGIFRFFGQKIESERIRNDRLFRENWRSFFVQALNFRELYDLKNYDPRDRDDHFCPECQIGRDILKANPDLAELASRWQFEGDEYQVRFDLLAKYLVEKGSSFDDHFTGQADSCGICHIDYKYIIKLETLHEG